MYEYLSIFYEQECWRLVDGSVIKIKAFLGVCSISFPIVQIGPDRSLIGESTFCLRPKSNAPYCCQSKNFFYNLHDFIFLLAQDQYIYEVTSAFLQ